MIMEILHICMNKECKVWTIKDNYRLGDEKSKWRETRKKIRFKKHSLESYLYKKS